MEDKVKTLIALGATVTANCQPCLEIAVGKARQTGITEQDIVVAVEIGKAVRSGTSAKMDAFISGIIKEQPSCGCESQKETKCPLEAC